MSSKRHCEDFSTETPRKKPSRVLRIQVDSDEEVGNNEGKVFYFRVLLPNGITLELQVPGPPSEMPVEDFVILVRREYQNIGRRTDSPKPRRQINWTRKDLHFVDAFDNRITKTMDFRKFKSNKSHMLRLCDGSVEADKYENMWDLTPDTDLLKELPEEYTFETALADLIDNSLQAVWSKSTDQRRLISLELTKSRITIFDTGLGMDGSAENSIVKWGKMGASIHRSARDRGIGGKPPYLTPYFGMFGYGGPIASMHLGRASVSSKTKECKKVYVLHLERDSLLRCSSSQQTWRVEIFYPKMRSESMQELQYKLKDIYFPYIQCDEVSKTGKTVMPIEFQVNGTNLAEIEGGEVATTNLLSCNGPEFVMQLSFQVKDSSGLKVGSGTKSSFEAHARLRCVYFPVAQGKESIEVILEKLEADGYGITENFETFSHVSVRRLGRLLPDARWSWLPFMEPKLRKSDRAEVLKRCCFRVKCFIETDAGFNPTPSKTDLAHHHPFTIALRNFGNKPSNKENDVLIEIAKDGKKLSLLQLEKLYQEWLFQMHDRYDEEIDCGEDQPTFVVVGPLHKKKLGVSADVMRIHKAFQRKGITWKAGQKIKILKGAYRGFHKNNIFATLEFIILEGWQGDSGGEARIICRPLNVPAESGCRLTFDKGCSCFEIRDSKSLPISVIDTGKCLSVDKTEWENQILKHQEKTTPSSIDILDAEQCLELEIEGALPQDVDAGHEPPEEITAVVRPVSFTSATASKNLDQKYIMKENFVMTLEIKFKADENEKEQHIYSGKLNPSSLKGFHGLYMFPLKKKSPNLFQTAGIYLFRFSLIESCTISVKEVRVKALSEPASWELVSDGKSTHSVRVGSCLPEVFSVACRDRFFNRIPFKSQTEIEMKLSSGGRAISSECSYDQYITHDSYTMKFKNVTIESSELDMIRPSYNATLHINSREDPFVVAIPCAVIPGPLQRILLRPVDFGKKLVPGMVLKELALETFDKYGNHMRKDEHIKLTLEGLHLLDKGNSFYKVDDHGCVNLSGTLKVTAGYGKLVSLSVLSGDEVVFKKEFQTDRRSLRVASKVPKVCAAGSHLEDVVFEVVNSAGEVDEDIDSEIEDGHSHTLQIRQDSLREEDNVRYSFHRGRCIVRSIPLPNNEGLFFFVASHSRFHELQTSIEVHVEKAVIQPRSPKKEILLLEESNGKGPETVCHDSYDGRIMIFNDSCASMVLEDRQQKLGDDICRYGLCIRQCDANVESLSIKQSNIELEMSNLGAYIGLDSFHDLFYDKDVIMEKIEGKADSAAAVIHKLLRSPKPEQLYLKYAHDILGVVALLGEVRTHKLSSMLSTYLGEDQMLAIVCKSRAAARALENYQMDGNVNCGSALDILAAKLGISIKGRYLVICLEDIRPYKQGVSSDPQRELAIPQPTLSNRETPPGFLGYAVNMIFLPAEYLQFRTASGYGLRETLFYRLLGKLQVYKSREQLYMASSCIEDGAVSLDGGMMRGNGVISASVGSEDPYILFPIICLERQLLLSPEKVERLKRIEELKLEQNQLQDRIQEELRNEAKYKKKLAKKLMDKKQIDDQFEDALLRIVPEAPLMHDPSLNQGGQTSSITFAGNRDIIQNRTAEAVSCHSKVKLEDAIEETGLQIKHHDDNIKFLEGQKNRLDDSILDLEAALAKTYSASGTGSENKESSNGQNEEETIEQILSFDKSAAAICVQLQKRTGAQITNIPFMKDIVGIVALLGKVDDDNLSRTLSDYLGQGTMLAIVCKTLDGLKALETYDKEGLIIKSSGLHGVGASIGRPLDDRYLVICLENLRPYTSEFIADDPQRRLSIKKPRYVNGKTLPGFLGFAVNMINIDTDNLYCVTSNGHGLRETLFYGLFSQLQVYKTRADMMQALPFIAGGAISLDGGIIKSAGIFSLGKREVQIKFPKSCGRSYIPENYFETEIRMKELKWERVRCVEDLEREQTLLTNAKNNFEIRKEEFVKFLSQSSSHL
nr:structural maintenance of chromosomes flexible hinge domain-containing protein GMI1 isoform X7 [Solanum lycopersicum]